jgi:hypothetical protein
MLHPVMEKCLVPRERAPEKKTRYRCYMRMIRVITKLTVIQGILEVRHKKRKREQNGLTLATQRIK